LRIDWRELEREREIVEKIEKYKQERRRENEERMMKRK